MAFCFLWDCEKHPRDHLEGWRNKEDVLYFPNPILEKIYSDPSKTVDELRVQTNPKLTFGMWM